MVVKNCQIGSKIECDVRLEYQIPLLKSGSVELEFAFQAYFGTENQKIKDYLRSDTTGLDKIFKIFFL